MMFIRMLLGMNDIVRCYACDVGLQRWDEGDDPWIEHAKWHPECPHVLRVKGSDFIELVQTTLESNVEVNIRVNTYIILILFLFQRSVICFNCLPVLNVPVRCLKNVSL